jgi:hypothetical protein
VSVAWHLLFPLFAAGVIDTRGGAGIVDTGGKFATGVNNTSCTGDKIFVDTSVLPWLANTYLLEFSKIFEMTLMFFFRGLGEGDSLKNPEAKNLVTLSL